MRPLLGRPNHPETKGLFSHHCFLELEGYSHLKSGQRKGESPQDVPINSFLRKTHLEDSGLLLHRQGGAGGSAEPRRELEQDDFRQK